MKSIDCPNGANRLQELKTSLQIKGKKTRRDVEKMVSQWEESIASHHGEKILVSATIAAGIGLVIGTGVVVSTFAAPDILHAIPIMGSHPLKSTGISEIAGVVAFKGAMGLQTRWVRRGYLPEKSNTSPQG